jgi:PIN domain nuclease of toxin-antitoxin system
MGEGLEDSVTYLDTHITVWLAQGDLRRIEPSILDFMRTTKLLVSPMVALELEYLHEIKRIKLSSQEILLKLKAEIGLEVCDFYSFPSLVEIAVNEKWTRDPFDRIIVSHAKVNGLSPLISSDEEIQKNYVKTMWL